MLILQWADKILSPYSNALLLNGSSFYSVSRFFFIHYVSFSWCSNTFAELCSHPSIHSFYHWFKPHYLLLFANSQLVMYMYIYVSVHAIVFNVFFELECALIGFLWSEKIKIWKFYVMTKWTAIYGACEQKQCCKHRHSTEEWRWRCSGARTKWITKIIEMEKLHIKEW